MATYLLTWNPLRSEWGDDLRELSQKVERKGDVPDSWSTGNRKAVHAGDRLFLLRQAHPPRGIMGSGIASGEGYRDRHWENKGMLANYVELRWDALLDPESYRLLPIEKMTAGPLRGYNWAVRASGVALNAQQAKAVEKAWAKHLRAIGYRGRREPALKSSIPREIGSQGMFVEGAKKQVIANRYERDPKAREACVAHWGCVCSACGFSFGKVYGEWGDGFIHVHHLRPLTLLGRRYTVDPANDLRPVCPNCHAMLHRIEPPLTIAQLKAHLNRRHRG